MISVLIPVTYPFPYLDRALLSIKKSILSCELEVLVVANGMTSEQVVECQRLINKYASVNILFYNLEKKGISDALNFGLEKCHFDYVARLDADDIMLPDRLAVQLAFLRAHDEIAAIGSYVAKIDQVDSFLGFQSFPVKGPDIALILGFQNCINHSSVMYRKNLVVSIGGYYSRDEPAEDYALWCRLIQKYEIANIPTVLTKYRIHQGQVSKMAEINQRAMRDQISKSFQAVLPRLIKAKSRVETSPNRLWRFYNWLYTLKLYSIWVIWIRIKVKIQGIYFQWKFPQGVL